MVYHVSAVNVCRTKCSVCVPVRVMQCCHVCRKNIDMPLKYHRLKKAAVRCVTLSGEDWRVRGK